MDNVSQLLYFVKSVCNNHFCQFALRNALFCEFPKLSERVFKSAIPRNMSYLVQGFFAQNVLDEKEGY